MRISGFFILLGLAVAVLPSLSAQSVRVIFVSGQASVQRPEEPALRPAVKGETVIIGTRIVTGPDGRLVLTPMPGVKSIVAPDTSLILESVASTTAADNTVKHQAVIDLKQGAVVSDLQKPENVTYDYNIRTARGLAGARGTTFTVGINRAGIQTIVVAHGLIAVTGPDGRSSVLSPGQLSITKINGETQQVGHVSELSAADQQVAQNWTDLTVAAIANAVDNGIAVAPEALANVQKASDGLGIAPSAETQAAVERALDVSDAPKPGSEESPAPDSGPVGPAPGPEGPGPGPEPAPEPGPGPGPAGTPTPAGPVPAGTGTEIVTPPPPKPPGPVLLLPPPPPPPPQFTPAQLDTGLSPLALFRSRLTATQLAAFDQRPADIQFLLVKLNDFDLARVALDTFAENGLPFTNDDGRFHLAGFAALTAESFAFVKGFGGVDATTEAPNFSDLKSMPDPAERSAVAFDRTRAAFNALTTAEQALLIQMGAGEAIMETSAAYMTGLLGEIPGLGIQVGGRSPAQISSLLVELGWGRHLGELAGKPTGVANLMVAAGLTTAERATVKRFEISPNHFQSGSQIISLVQALSGQSLADQKILIELGIGHQLQATFRQNPMATVGYSGMVANVLAFNALLTPDEQIAARAVGLGQLMYDRTATAILGPTSETVLQRAQALTAFYLAYPSYQETLRDSRLFADNHFLTSDTNNPTLDSAATIIATLNIYQSLPARTRNYLSTLDGSLFAFYKLVNPGSPNFFRSLATINILLEGLSPVEFSTLLDLNLATAIMVEGYIEQSTSTIVDHLGSSDTSRLQALQATIAYFTQLPLDQRNILHELGIVGSSEVAFIGADTAGLDRLLAAYTNLPAPLIVQTEQLQETGANNKTFGSTGGPVVDRSFFFPAGVDSTRVMQSVQFHSTGDLYVGATRYLQINGAGLSAAPTFIAGTNKNRDLYLRAADLIDLTSTGFSAGIRSITMSAATINLSNLSIPEGTVASFNSKLGVTNFGATKVPGKVNFNNVSYGVLPLGSAADLTNAARGNIAIGSLAAPAPLPTFTPLPP